MPMHNKNQGRIRVKASLRETPDYQKLAEAVLGLAKTLTAEQAAELKAKAKDRHSS